MPATTSPPININISLKDSNQKTVYQGQDVEVLAQPAQQLPKDKDVTYNWSAHFGPYTAPIAPNDPKKPLEATLQTDGAELGTYTVKVELIQGDKTIAKGEQSGIVEVLPPATLRGSGPVTLGRTTVGETKDVTLWVNIRQSTDELAFPKYQEFINEVMCEGPYSRTRTQQSATLRVPLGGIGEFLVGEELAFGVDEGAGPDQLRQGDAQERGSLFQELGFAQASSSSSGTLEPLKNGCSGCILAASPR